MDGWIYSTLPSARTPKNQGVLFVGVPSAGGAVAGRAGRRVRVGPSSVTSLENLLAFPPVYCTD